MTMPLIRHLLPSMLLMLVPATAMAGIPVEGRVLGPDGQGLPGARVEVRPVLRVYEQGVRDLEGQGEPAPVAKTLTEPGGWYRIEAPREGIWRVVIAGEGFVTVESGPMVLAGESPLDDASMKPDDGLLVRVEGADGKPVAGARVAAQPGSRVPWTDGWRPVDRTGVSGADGTLRLPRAKEETLRLSALAPGHAPGRVDGRDSRSLTFRLQPASRWMLRASADGRPVADALVRDAASLLPVGRTDAEGVLIADAPAAGPWDLRVETRDGRIAPFAVPELPGTVPRDRPRSLILPPLVPLSGRVVDGTAGRPVPGALVWPLTDPAAGVRTDASGAFRLPWTANTSGWLQADRTGYFYGQGPFSLVTRAAAAPALVLQPSGSLSGVAVDERGRPVAGAEIRILHQGEDLRRVRASAQGRFHLPHLHPGASYELLAVARGLAPARDSVTVLGTSPTDLRLVLGRSRTAIGQIVDEAGGPVAGAEVELVRNLIAAESRSWGAPETSAEDGLYRAETGSEGRFEIPGLPAGWFDLEVRGPGFVPLALPGIQTEDELELDLGTVTLRRGATLAGRVSGPDGEPVPDAQVWIVPDEEAGERVWREFLEAGPAATTGPDGRFAVSGLAPDGPLILDVCRPGHLTAHVQQAELPDDAMEITLRPAARLSGRVVGPGGEPVARARVGTHPSGASPDDTFPVLLRARPCPWSSPLQQEETDTDGRFTLEPLPAGTYGLWAVAEGYLRAKQDGHEVEPGRESAEATLVLDRGALVAGRVLTAEGAPVAGAGVHVSGSDAYPEGKTDGDGVYRISGAEPGERSVVARHPRFGDGGLTVEIRPGENRVDLTLEPRNERKLSGRVVGPDGEPVQGARVEIQNNPFEHASAYTLQDGSFTLSTRGADHFELLATKPGYSPARLDDWSVAGAGEGLELRLGRTSGLSGRILGVATEDLPRVEILATEEQRLQRRGFASPDGVYRILELSPGSWHVSARLGSRSVEARVEIRPGEEEVLDLSLPLVSEVSGRVVGAEGEPIAGAYVKLASPAAELWGATEVDGSFSIDAQNGTYAVVAEKDGHPFTRLKEPVTVDGAPVAGLEIRMARGASITGRILGVSLSADETVNVWAQVGRLRHFADVEDGVYRIDSLAPGEWQVIAHYGVNKVERRATVDPGQEAVELDLPFSLGNLTLSGRIDSYRRLKGGSVQLHRIDDPGLMAFGHPDEDGAFRIGHIPPGRYVLAVRETTLRTLFRQELDLTTDVELVIPIGDQRP